MLSNASSCLDVRDGRTPNGSSSNNIDMAILSKWAAILRGGADEIVFTISPRPRSCNIMLGCGGSGGSSTFIPFQ